MCCDIFNASWTFYDFWLFRINKITKEKIVLHDCAHAAVHKTKQMQKHKHKTWGRHKWLYILWLEHGMLVCTGEVKGEGVLTLGKY